ncbi:MAG: GGDEF domain-containing protein, partial [Pseudomonadota bacterium]
RNDGLPAYTASIGIACQLSAEEDLDGILLRADGALYRAKALGRDRIEVAEPASAPPRAALV